MTLPEEHVLQVIINMQASLELLSKLFVLQHEGWKGIIEKKFHNMPETKIKAFICEGTIKTTPYWKNRDYMSQEIYLNKIDKDLLVKFQEHRNQIMHLGIVKPSHEILNESIWFMVRIINQLNWQDTLPMKDQYLSNSLETLIGKKLYQKLKNNSCYVDEAIDRAYELFPDDVKHCLQCGEDSWVLNDDGYRICIVCGFRGDEEMFGFTDCPFCYCSNEVVFDALNIGYNEYIKGKCCFCKKFVNVSKCSDCGNVFLHPGQCNFCL